MKSSLKTMIGILVVMVAVALIVAFISVKQPPVPENTTTEPIVTDAPTEVPAPTDTPVNTTTPLPSEVILTTAPDGTIAPTANGNQPTSTPTTSAQESDADIVAQAVSAINALKKNTGTLKANKDQVIDVQITECSIPGARGIVNSALQNLVGTTNKTYNVSNGTAVDAENNEQSKFSDCIPPSNKDFGIDMNGVASVSKTANGGNTLIVIKLKPESTTFTAPAPTYHAQAMDYLDLTTIDLGPIKITDANMDYAGATIEITLDSQGRVIKYHENMPIKGDGTGSAGILSAKVGLEGYLDETWTITY
jgi:hypothetical protein